MRLRVTVLALGGLALASSCAKVPPPTQEEIYARDQWAALVTEQDRHDVFEQANVHTGWSEKRKVVYELASFQHLARSEDKKARAATRKEASTKAHPGTKPTSHPATRPASRPTTHATTRHHHLTTSPDDSDE